MAAAKRRLIICADGTWNRPDEQDHGVDAPTNVAKMRRAVTPQAADGTSQVVYYHTGVGTHGGLDKLLGGGFGEGIDEVILDCYSFLVHNYVPGDELYFFGFSRGAYTARSLAGLIRNSGLLKPDCSSMTREAFNLYRDRDPEKHPSGDIASGFRAQYSYEVDIECVGVWDTVGALGIPLGLFDKITERRHGFHDVGLSSHVRNAFHALAIDERRKPFQPTLWEQPAEDMEKNWLEQAWFAGVHSNVGGGYADSSLSDHAFRWMVDRVRSRCAIEFDQGYVDRIAPALPGKLYDSMTPGFELLGVVEREIDAAAAQNRARGVNTWEYVHKSAYEFSELTRGRHDEYGPANLRRYLGRQTPQPLVDDRLLDSWRGAGVGAAAAPPVTVQVNVTVTPGGTATATVSASEDGAARETAVGS